MQCSVLTRASPQTMVGGGLGDGGGRGVQQIMSASAGLQLSNVNDPSVPSQRQGLYAPFHFWI